MRRESEFNIPAPADPQLTANVEFKGTSEPPGGAKVPAALAAAAVWFALAPGDGGTSGIGPTWLTQVEPGAGETSRPSISFRARTIDSLAVNEDFPPQLRLQYFLNRLGLEETLQAVTSEPPVPDGDKLVPQLGHQARGTEIVRTFLVDPRIVEGMKAGNPMLDDFFPEMARHEVCEGRTFIPLLKAGATVINSYGDGAHELVAITLTARDCGLSRGFLAAW